MFQKQENPNWEEPSIFLPATKTQDASNILLTAVLLSLLDRKLLTKSQFDTCLQKLESFL